MTDTSAETPFVPKEQRIFVLVAAILASAMGFIDGSVTSIATPAIRLSINATLADAQWVSNAYLLTLSSLLLLGGAASDRFGLRNVFAAGITVFVIASIASALAPTPALLIAARAIQGAGAAFMVPGSLAIIAKAYPKEERGGAIGVWASASSLTTLLGPVIGGLILTWLGAWSWRLIFALNLPLGGIALFLLLTRTPADTPHEGRRLDIVGAIGATIALLLISLAFIDNEDGRFWPYLIAGLVVLALFLFWETRSKAPMLPLTLFKDKGFSGAQGLTFVLYFGLSAVTFYLPMTMIAGWGISPALVAIALLPLGIALTLLSPTAGKVTDRLGPGPVLTIGSLIVGVAFLALGLTAHMHSLWFAVLPIMVVFGVGYELCRRAGLDRGDDVGRRPRHGHRVGRQQCGGARRRAVRRRDDGSAGGVRVRACDQHDQRHGFRCGADYGTRSGPGDDAGRGDRQCFRDHRLCDSGAGGGVSDPGVDDAAA